MVSLRDLFARRVDPEAINNQDTVIIVIGPSGAGKSSFIDHATNGNHAEVGHGLASHTGAVQGFRCPYPDNVDQVGNVVFVDTPAFNHDSQTIADVEKRISRWMKRTAARGVRVAGVLYMHRITDRRIVESPLVHLRAFEKLCGNDFPRRILLVTTMWDMVNADIGDTREQNLLAEHWRTMILSGSGTHRFGNNTESAWEAVQHLLTL